MASIFDTPLFRRTMDGKAFQHEERLRDIEVAETQGHNFITLKHRINSDIAEIVNGVEAVKVVSFKNHVDKTMKHDIKVIQAGDLVFIPDPRTSVRWGYLLDTPYNRRLLATHWIEDRWEIYDGKVRETVQEAAGKIKVEVDTSKTQRKVTFSGHETEEDALANMTPDQLKDAIDREQKSQNARLAVLKRKNEEALAKESIPLVSTPQLEEAQGVPPKGAPEPKVVGGVGMSNKDAKKVAIAANADLVNRLKEKSPRAYHLTSEYKKEVQPLIDKLKSGAITEKDLALADN